jgi:2-oxoglutarate/2-oxoacid ferredoxin oxidoreductase subunit alpha
VDEFSGGGFLDYTIKIGGEAGQGIQTIGDGLARVFARAGYHVFIHQDYESRIRGGHNFFQIRFSEKPILASRRPIDIVIALDRPSITNNRDNLTESGIIVYDSTILKQTYEGPEFLNIPSVELAIKDGGSKVMANTVATGVVLGMLGMDLAIFEEVLKEVFAKKGDAITQQNISAARLGSDFAGQYCERCAFSVAPPGTRLMLIDGNTAVGVGAVMSGCKFYTAYPMTPSTGVLTYMASKSDQYGIMVEQAEDEIAAINMALGACFAGVRSMTGTAGGGFALMVEGLSLAAMTETPVVIVLGQRPAPATGLPTRTEQGDLLFALHTGHGEFPRIVFAPGSPDQVLQLTNKAFDLSHKYQIPAIILTDQYLADTQWTYDGFDLSQLKYEDYRLKGDKFASLPCYQRHAFTDSGVSPFAVPGDARHVVVTDSDEHDEEGHIAEDADIRMKMVKKRLYRKLPLLTAEIAPPTLYGNPDARTVFVAWGSMYGVLREATERLEERGAAMLHFTELYPFPGTDKFDYMTLLKKAKRTVCVEQNATSQFARLLKAETGFSCNDTINKYDGRPFLVEELLGELNAHLG